MSNRHPIIPPPELVHEWWDKVPGTFTSMVDETHLATQAAQWGADQELEACCEWVGNVAIVRIADNLRAARRPKPPSLKEQALEVLNITQKGYGLAQVDLYTIRQALEALPDD